MNIMMNQYNINYEKSIHKQDLDLMYLCIEIAKKSDMRCQHGCIIEDSKGNIISKACNKSNNLPEKHVLDDEKRPLFSRHAEETALKNVDKTKLKGAKLYVVRWGGKNDGEMCFMNLSSKIKMSLWHCAHAVYNVHVQCMEKMFLPKK